ncbi:hypothetical protein NDU88_001107 [Pleurodeles waltl]|uniref:ribonuclease H n=1 Tax=Pleurodeles waltl TaxID=8319 RepID=A0AAV7SYM8_PLEWA|nr:hypothetical protein NDU88_001107 [Pleurodeles waltl]
MERAQDKQKRYYDRNTQLRSFSLGDKVLVLLPSSDNKLLAKWQGPYTVTGLVTPVTYKIQLNDTPPRSQIFHVNLLKRWEEPPNDPRHGCLVNTVKELEIGWCPTDPPGEREVPIINTEISIQQNRQLKNLFDKHGRVFSSVPGRTRLVHHQILTPPGKTVRLKPYRIPEARKTLVENEIEKMLDLDIIEPSQSPWCSPVVLVPKPDGSIRFCIDFRRVNSISQFDTYPLPRIDELLERLGKAKYMSTLDLTKGYWQIPLGPEDKEKTAFATPSGLYHFKVLPFGLHGAPPPSNVSLTPYYDLIPDTRRPIWMTSLFSVRPGKTIWST